MYSLYEYVPKVYCVEYTVYLREHILDTAHLRLLIL